MVWADSGTDTRESLYAIAAQHHWPLRCLFRHEATLEDVFVELTRKD
jgi:ABC-2 type transport system ATP-binding protein